MIELCFSVPLNIKDRRKGLLLHRQWRSHTLPRGVNWHPFAGKLRCVDRSKFSFYVYILYIESLGFSVYLLLYIFWIPLVKIQAPPLCISKNFSIYPLKNIGSEILVVLHCNVFLSFWNFFWHLRVLLFYRHRKLILQWRHPGNHVVLMQLLIQGLEIHNVKRVHYPLRGLLITTSRTWTDCYVLCVSPWKLSAIRLQAVTEIMPLLAKYFCTRSPCAVSREV